MIPKIDRNNAGNQSDIQAFNNKQIYTKGFEFNTQAAITNEFPIILNGNARQLFGICLFVEAANINDNDLVSLSINEENVITNVIWWNFNPSGVNGNVGKLYAYFPIHRSLSGSDSIQLVWNSVNAHKIYPVFYMSNSIESAILG